MTLVPFLVALLVFAAAVLLLGRRRTDDPARRIARLVERRAVVAPPADAGMLRRPFASSERWLAQTPGWGRFTRLLERAGVERSPVATWWVLAVSLLLAAVLGLAVGGPVAGVVLLLAGAAAIRLALGLRAARRRRRFDDQLPDVLAEISSALRAGHGFLQAVQAVAADAPSPIGPELQRVLAEARLGRPLEDALLAAGDRIGSEDFDFVLDAVVVQRQVGGSLAGIFEVVGDSVRQRQQAALKLRALTATGRLSAAVLLGLPIAIAFMLTLLNHTYMQPLYGTGTGRLLLGGSLALVAVGSLWLHRIVSEVG